MIRINLVAVERERTKRKAAFQIGQQVTLLCGLVLALAIGVIGWRYLTVNRDSKALDEEITRAQEETTRLHAILQQVQQFEQQRGQLQQRVTLIEQLRKGQTGPVHMLDQISRALPPMLWLTEMKQTGEDVVIDGRCLQMTSLSDFIANLEASGYFRRSVEIVSSTAEAMPQPPGELIKFSIKARYQTPGAPAAPAPATPPKPGAKTGA